MVRSVVSIAGWVLPLPCAIGTELGLPEAIVWRHPFPGPGLAVRCLGEVTKEKLDVLRECDVILLEEIVAADLDDLAIDVTLILDGTLDGADVFLEVVIVELAEHHGAGVP